MEKETKFKVVMIAVIALVILAIPVTIAYVYEEREATLPIKTEIERGVEIKDVENKFVKNICLGGAGGLGAPEMKCKDANQFIELVEPNETVYVDFEVTRYTADLNSMGLEGTLLEKTYYAFIENRAGIMSYTDTYLYIERPDSFWLERAFKVKSYNTDSVVFVKGNWLTVFGLLILIEIIIVCFGRVASQKIVYNTWDPFY
ncbi:MAG: hypothetical protein WBC21_00475 [Minisyncoccales bacterium]